STELDKKVSRQSEVAVSDADVVLFLVDASVGVTEDDQAVAEWLKRSNRPVILVANKSDNERREHDMWEFLALGLGEPHPISALHGRRTGDLLDEVLALFPPEEPEEDVEFDPDAAAEKDPSIPGVALVGRPNVGKSTLFNRLIGEQRAVVHDMPGTTRDSIDTIVETADGPIRFIDTAGMRRRSKVDDGTEYYSVVRTLQSVDTADVALLLIDATEGVTAQDQRLAERIDAAGCPVVVLMNKWELLDAEARLDVMAQLHRQLHFIGDAPVLKISALSGLGVHKLAPVLADAIERYHRRVPTRKVNKVIVEAQARQPAPHGAKVLYALQGAADPPTFTLFTNRELPHTYMRYLENQIREAFDFGSVPIKLRVRKRSS
ncbi:MAG: engA, partial [Acidimicrobiia bacterium]|nr:engA [Acidimicrobiia bacterium]